MLHTVLQEQQNNNKTTACYSYDALGNQLVGGLRTLPYTPFNQVESIQQGIPHQVAFTYGPERTRITRTNNV